VAFIVIVWENTVEPGRPTDDNMTHAHCMLVTWGYRHTLRICNTLFLFQCNIGCTKERECYVIRTLSVSLRTPDVDRFRSKHVVFENNNKNIVLDGNNVYLHEWY